MTEEPFIKRGVVAGETESDPIVTDQDQAVKAAMQAPRKCCGRCGCKAKEASREDQDSE